MFKSYDIGKGMESRFVEDASGVALIVSSKLIILSFSWKTN